MSSLYLLSILDSIHGELIVKCRYNNIQKRLPQTFDKFAQDQSFKSPIIALLYNDSHSVGKSECSFNWKT